MWFTRLPLGPHWGQSWGPPCWHHLSSDVRGPGPDPGSLCPQRSQLRLRAQASVLAPREPSDPGLVQAPLPGTWGPRGHPEGGLSRGHGQAGRSAGKSAQPCPHIPFRCLSGLGDLRFWSDRTLLQSAPLPARQCQPVSSCLAEWPWALQAAGGRLTQPLPVLGLLVWTCSHCLLLSPVLWFFNLLL